MIRSYHRLDTDEIFRLTRFYYAPTTIDDLQDILKQRSDICRRVDDCGDLSSLMCNLAKVCDDDELLHDVLRMLGYITTPSVIPSLQTTELQVLAVSQFTKYYPARLDDYLNGKIKTTIHLLHSKSDIAWAKQVFDMASITDPNCRLVVGFEQARLFLSANWNVNHG